MLFFVIIKTLRLYVFLFDIEGSLTQLLRLQIATLIQLLRLQIATQALKRHFVGLPLWSGGCESALQCRGPLLDPWSGKIPYAAEQQNPCAAATEPECRSYGAGVPQLLKPACLEPVLHCSEKPSFLNPDAMS